MGPGVYSDPALNLGNKVYMYVYKPVASGMLLHFSETNLSKKYYQWVSISH